MSSGFLASQATAALHVMVLPFVAFSCCMTLAGTMDAIVRFIRQFEAVVINLVEPEITKYEHCLSVTMSHVPTYFAVTMP